MVTFVYFFPPKNPGEQFALHFCFGHHSVQICQKKYTGCKLTLNQSCKMILSIPRKHTSSSEEMQVKSIWVFWMDGGMDGGWTGKHFSIGFQFSSLTIVVELSCWYVLPIY
jgi:hypothetical protein